MGIVEELQAQKGFILEHKWVARKPDRTGEACLVARRESIEGLIRVSAYYQMSDEACYVVGRAIKALHPDWVGRREHWGWTALLIEPAPWPPAWNDKRERTVSEVMEVLDEAILIAKEQEMP